MRREGICRACGAPMLWAPMPSGAHNPLNVEQVAAEVGKGVIAYNPATGRGIPITIAVIDRCEGWAAHGVTFHVSHFADCPQRSRFRQPQLVNTR